MFREAPLCEKHAEMATIVIELPIMFIIALLLSAIFYMRSDTVTLWFKVSVQHLRLILIDDDSFYAKQKNV